MSGDSGKSEPGPLNATWWHADCIGKLQSVCLAPPEETSSSREPTSNLHKTELSSKSASQILWATGTLSAPVPDGFYSIIPDKKLKELYDIIPCPDDIFSLGMDASKADIILVDTQKDKKLSMLKQWSAALVKGLNTNPALLIKKIAGLVSDVYRRLHSELSPAKAVGEDTPHLLDNRGIQLLGQIRHGSCRVRAVLFKVLADAAGLECKLIVGLPSNSALEYADSNKHMSIVVLLNSVELLVDLMRFPGQLIPFSTKAMLMSHISPSGESDSAENDSCDSPLEPNSPLYGFSDRLDGYSQEQDENLQTLFQRRLEASAKAAGPSTPSLMMKSRTISEGKLSVSDTEPNVTNAFWSHNQRKSVAEQQRTVSPSPERPLFRTRARSMLGGDRQPCTEYEDGIAASRSGGASISEVRRTRRRSISITPEIGDDIVRAVRAMNETLKQNRPLTDPICDVSGIYSTNDKYDLTSMSGNVGLSGGIYDTCNTSKKQASSTEKASSSLSPREIKSQTSERSEDSGIQRAENMLLTWDKVLQSSPFLNKPLLPFEEWNIGFSELTVGTRVGIGFFGEVFRGVWNGTEVAIKVFLEQDLTVENMEDFCNEIHILSRLRHPNVILFLGACMKPPHLSMVTEYMEMGSLFYLIHMSGQKKKLSWRRRLKMLRDICRGLMCIHRMKIVHRDVKSANCLVDKHYAVKICDFGLSRAMGDAPICDNSSAGTPEWMAPELIRNEPFTEKCDIFSLGVIMWELCTLNRPWEGVSPVQVVYAVANEGSRLEIPEGPLGKLISDCWAEPNERPSCQEILTRLHDCEYTLC